MRKNISIFLKSNVIICALAGIIISSINAQFDGYSHWTRRLLYFTSQSNLWILISTILFLLPSKDKYRKTLYINRYVFTVAITLTAIIFCFLLAPFADESYHVWSLSGLLTHVFVPLFAIADFFVDEGKEMIERKDIFSCLIPGLVYSIVTSLLFFFKIDFGRGDNFPYFFYNYLSPAGVFGFSSIFPFFIGSFYWITFIVSLNLFVSIFYANVNNRLTLKNSILLDRK